MRPVPSRNVDRDTRMPPALPKGPPPAQTAASQRDLVIWSLLVCPKADKAKA